MNIYIFARVDDAYVIPTAHPNATQFDLFFWSAVHLFADMKFLSLFSLLFGAGIVIIAERRMQIGKTLSPFWFRRMGWLSVIGLIHAYLIWEGDILVTYAICGLVVARFHALPPKKLWLIGGGALLVGSLIWIVLGVLTRVGIAFDPSVADELMSDPDLETAAMRGTLLEQFRWRSQFVLEAHFAGIPFFGIWRCGGLMLIGMALQKSGFFTAQFPRRVYWRTILVGLPLGYLITGLGIALRERSDWDAIFCLFEGVQINYVGSLFTTAAYAALLILWASSSWLQTMQNALCAVGRTALSNYLFQSVLATLIFNGHGLGMFGKLTHPQLLGIIFLIWIAQIGVTLIWLKYFQSGPVEWIWRRLTYRKPISLRLGSV